MIATVGWIGHTHIVLRYRLIPHVLIEVPLLVYDSLEPKAPQPADDGPIAIVRVVDAKSIDPLGGLDLQEPRG